MATSSQFLISYRRSRHQQPPLCVEMAHIFTLQLSFYGVNFFKNNQIMTIEKQISLEAYYSSLQVLVKMDESKETLVSSFSSLNLIKEKD